MTLTSETGGGINVGRPRNEDGTPDNSIDEQFSDNNRQKHISLNEGFNPLQANAEATRVVKDKGNILSRILGRRRNSG